LKSGIKDRLKSVVFWAVISAAFLGPGTVTTAASSGSNYGFNLIWVLTLSTIICIVLQVNVAKISIDTGLNLGALLKQKFQNYLFIPVAIAFSIMFGCMAYQAGNLLGAALGLQLLFDIDQSMAVLLLSISAGTLLWYGSINLVIRLLGIVVALMGFAFVFMIFSIDFDGLSILSKSFSPTVPDGSEILIMGLIGTTIVPYNLFMGSSLSKNKSLSGSKFGLTVAIALGGLISISVMLVGTLTNAPFSFAKLSEVLGNELGNWARYLLAFGLFGAGFTSAITAPLAAVFTISSVFPERQIASNPNNIRYRSIWGAVMLLGLIFGFLDFKPIAAIIVAQAVNGILLPFIVCFILILNVKLVERRNWLDNWWKNLPLISVTFIITSLGIFNLLKLLGYANEIGILVSALGGIIILSLIITFALRR